MGTSKESDHDLLDMANLACIEWEKVAETYLDPKAPGYGVVPTPDRRDNLQSVLEKLNGMTQRLARFTAYMETRYGYGSGDQGHADAVKEQNRVVAKVRTALGFTEARNDINF